MTQHLVSSCILLLAASAAAQTTTAVTLTVGNMVYRQAALSTTSNSYVDGDLRATGASGPDNLFSHWWWYRVAGDTQETAFRNDAAPNAPTRTLAAPTLTTTWPNVAGRNLFSANLTHLLVSTGSASGYLQSSMTITNTSASPLTIAIFAYGDLDVNGSNAANDCYGDDRSHYVERQAALSSVGEFYCPDADASQASDWLTTTAGALPFVLTNTTVDDLTGWSGTLTNVDTNSAFQWTRTIAPSASETFTTYLALTPSRPLESRYGAGVAGTPGIPAIAASARAITTGVVARSFDIELSNAQPTSLSLLLTNFSSASLPFSGLTILVNPSNAAVLFGLTDAAGADARTFAIPASFVASGLPLYHQFLVLDAGGPGGLASQTEGLAQTVASW